MQINDTDKKEEIKSKMLRAAIIIFLLLLSLSIPAVMVSIAMQSSDDVAMTDEEPLNKKQGLPQHSDPDEKL